MAVLDPCLILEKPVGFHSLRPQLSLLVNGGAAWAGALLRNGRRRTEGWLFAQWALLMNGEPTFDAAEVEDMSTK